MDLWGIISIDEPLNQKFLSLKDNVKNLVEKIPEDIKEYLIKIHNYTKFKILVGLPTSLVHIYLAVYPASGYYNPTTNQLFVYYNKGMETYFLRTIVHESMHCYYYRIKPPHKRISIDRITPHLLKKLETIKLEEIVFDHIINETLANLAAIKLVKDDDFIKHVRDIIDLFSKYKVTECNYLIFQIFLPRALGYIIAMNYDYEPLELARILSQKPDELYQLLASISNEKHKRVAFSLLYPCIEEKQKLNQLFQLSPEQFQNISIGQASKLIKEEKINGDHTRVYLSIVALAAISLEKGKDYVKRKFDWLFKEFEKLADLKETIDTILYCPEYTLNAYDEIVPGTKDLLAKIPDKEKFIEDTFRGE